MDFWVYIAGKRERRYAKELKEPEEDEKVGVVGGSKGARDLEGTTEL
jgi:hypothetical protein